VRTFGGIHLFIALIFSSIGILSCRDEHKGIPAQISIDSVSLNPSTFQGNNIHQIRGVQVFANDELLGNFEIPCKIPITKLGNVKIQILPLVYINGSKNNLGIYTPLAAYLDTFLLQAGKRVQIQPVFTFRTNAFVRWNEDFEDNNSTLIPIAPSPFPGDSISIANTNFDLNGKFKSTTKAYRILFENIDSSKYIDIGSFEEFKDLPLDGSSVFFEFDVKSDLPIQLAMRRQNSTSNELVPYLLINKTEGQWKRFYVNLVFELANQPAGTSIRLFFDINKPEVCTVSREIFIDNLRLSFLK
jgi:hypothetical protein